MSDEESAGGGSDDEQKPKKRKIDLKSRLSNVRATGSMAAMPRDSNDPLAFPPPVLGAAVPAPKMVSSAAAAFKPPVSSAFATPEPEVKPTVQQQTIKLEDHEIQQERQASAKKSLRSFLIGFVVALGLGAALGTVYQHGAEGRAAQKGASELAKDVTAATGTMKELSDKLLSAQQSFGNEQYPDDLATFVKQTKVAFDATKFNGRGVGALPPETLKQLIKFTQGVDELNKKIDRLSAQLNNPKVKEAIQKYWAQRKDPVINFSILLDRRGDDYFALLVPNKQPFKPKELPADKYTVTRPPSGQEKEGKDVEGKRLSAKVKLEDANLIPVDESSVARLTTQQAVAQLAAVLNETRGLMEAQPSASNPEDTEPGLIKVGDDIATALGKIK